MVPTHLFCSTSSKKQKQSRGKRLPSLTKETKKLVQRPSRLILLTFPFSLQCDTLHHIEEMVFTIYKMTGHFITATLPQGWAVPFHLPKDLSQPPKSLFPFTCGIEKVNWMGGERSKKKTPASPAYHKLTTVLWKNIILEELLPCSPPSYTYVCVRACKHKSTTYTHPFHYTKELLQGKFSLTLMASDCSLATLAF